MISRAMPLIELCALYALMNVGGRRSLLGAYQSEGPLGMKDIRRRGQARHDRQRVDGIRGGDIPGVWLQVSS
jgi:hypothetical protein